MNELISRNVFCRELQPVVLFARVTIGATGAPTLVTASSSGFASITRTDTGDYTIALNGRYKRILNMDANYILASGIPTGATVNIVADSVSSGSFTIACADAAAADPTNGATMLITLWLANL